MTELRARALSPWTARNLMLTGLVLAVSMTVSTAVRAGPIHYAGKPAELSISSVSEHTAQIVLAPLDDQGRARSAPPSTVLVKQQLQLKWRRRELTAAETVAVGKLRLEVKPQPLTIVIYNAAGKMVQEFVFTEADGTMSFRADAPILGMGEGARQFDRRGGLYTMKDGWGAWKLPIFGSWVAVPFLIGTDGWAFFVHSPRGSFDLRERTASFKPAADQRDLPLELYVIAWDRPADVLQEFVRLTGRPVLPPKWALGYMQSHRTLSGPDEVLQVARTFHGSFDASVAHRDRHAPIVFAMPQSLSHTPGLEASPPSVPRRRAWRWQTRPLLVVLLCLTWCAGDSLPERFETARAFHVAVHQRRRRPGKTFAGFEKALAHLPMPVLRALAKAVRGRLVPPSGARRGATRRKCYPTLNQAPDIGTAFA